MALLDPEELEAKGLADYPPPTELPRELADRVDYLAPHPPQALREDDWPRWALSARLGALIAIDRFDEETDTELRKLAWSVARALLNDPDTFPMDDPAMACVGAP